MFNQIYVALLFFCEPKYFNYLNRCEKKTCNLAKLLNIYEQKFCTCVCVLVWETLMAFIK